MDNDDQQKRIKRLLKHRAAELLPLLQEIAFESFLSDAGKKDFVYEKLLGQTANSLSRPLPEGITAATVATLSPPELAQSIVQELRDKRVLVPFAHEAAFTFPQRSIAEYLAARELSERLQSGAQRARELAWELVAKKAKDPDWMGVLVFLKEKLSDSPNNLRRVLSILKNE